MKFIPVHRGGEVVAYAKVDDADHAALAEHRWTDNGWGYAARRERGRTILMHREVLGLVYGDGRVTHHRNEEPLDNRRSNLEACDSIRDHAQLSHDRRDTIATHWYRLTRGNTISLTPDEVYAMAKAGQ